MKATIVRIGWAEKIVEEWGSLVWNASSALGPSSELTLGICTIRPGFSNPLHSHPNCEEVLRVDRGKIRHTIEGKVEEVLGEGDTIVIPRNLAHHATNIGEVDAVLTIAFSSAKRQARRE